MYTRASAPLLLCMHAHENDQMTTTEQDIVGPGELYIVLSLYTFYSISLHPHCSINLIYILLYIYTYMHKSVLHHTLDHWSTHLSPHLHHLHIQHLLPLYSTPYTHAWRPHPLHPCMVTPPLHPCITCCPSAPMHGEPMLPTPSLSTTPAPPLSSEGPQAGTHVHSLLVW